MVPFFPFERTGGWEREIKRERTYQIARGSFHDFVVENNNLLWIFSGVMSGLYFLVCCYPSSFSFDSEKNLVLTND